jgi:hypothetical protein
MEQGKCRKCSTEIADGTSLTICNTCHKPLEIEIKAFSYISITLAVLSLCVALTGIVFFFIAATRPDDSYFKMGAARNSPMTTPRSLLMLAGFTILVGVAMAVGSRLIKRYVRKKENEYQVLAGKRLFHNLKDSSF